jgi:hypothetical protein
MNPPLPPLIEGSDRVPGADPSKEARDTVAGCRDRAGQDRLHAANAATENARQVFERSAASWEARAAGILDGEDASEKQRISDRELWASGEQDDPTDPRDEEAKA